LNTGEYIAMIAEFAKIDTCDWARLVLHGLAETVGAFYDDDERSPFDEMKNIAMVERYRKEIVSCLERMNRQLVPDLGDL